MAKTAFLAPLKRRSEVSLIAPVEANGLGDGPKGVAFLFLARTVFIILTDKKGAVTAAG